MSIFNIFSGRKEAIKLPFSTDIHCHIVPGVDDGSPDAETSADLVERMQAWGIRRIIASPHVTECSFENTPDILDPALEELHAELQRRGNGINVSRSSENRIDDYFRDLLAAGQIKTMPDDYILVENSFIQEPWQLDQFLYDLRIKGLRPILAHPERYPYYHEHNLSRYDELHHAGTFFQINVLSLAGAYGKQEKKVAEKLIEKGYVDFLGTDLHNMRHAEIIDKYLTTSDARKHYAALSGRLMNDRAFSPSAV
ncbi:MAG: hypothetical protein NC339_04165 [Muribaculaceae bacterium]|nr:hypothetical protein [Muribaculaceae bacterium]